MLYYIADFWDLFNLHNWNILLSNTFLFPPLLSSGNHHSILCCSSLSTLFFVFQLLSHVRLFATTWAAAHQASLSITNSRSLLTLMSTESVMPPNHLILLPPSPHAFNLSQHQDSELAFCIRCPKCWSFRFRISPSNEYSGLISFRIDWFDFLAVQGTLKSLLQHRNSKASVLQHSAFFMVQLSHLYMTQYRMCSVCSVVSDSLWPLDCSLPDSSVHGIFQARMLSGLPFCIPEDLPNPRDWGRFFTTEPPWEVHCVGYYVHFHCYIIFHCVPLTLPY